MATGCLGSCGMIGYAAVIKDGAWSSTQWWAASSQAGNPVTPLHSNKPPENAAALAIPILASHPSKSYLKWGEMKRSRSLTPSIPYNTTHGTAHFRNTPEQLPCHKHRVKCQMCHRTDSSPSPHKVLLIPTSSIEKNDIQEGEGTCLGHQAKWGWVAALSTLQGLGMRK